MISHLHSFPCKSKVTVVSAWEAKRASRILKRLFYIKPPPSSKPNHRKANEYNLPLHIGLTDYEKTFSTVEQFSITEALRKANLNKTCVKIVQNICSQATAKIHLHKLVSDEFTINRGVKQGNSFSPKLFTAVMEEFCKKAGISEGINVDGENLTNLRFADNVALLNAKQNKRKI